MKTILLTGGTGYIGSHSAVEFLNSGYKVIILDNLSNSSANVLEKIEKITNKKVKFYKTDLLNKSDLDKIFLENKIEGVIHFAGLKSVGESCEKPFLYYENNIIGSLNLFEIMEKYSVKDIIFSSSATVYSPENKSPLKETDIVGNTTNPYGTTKLIIENLLKDLANYKNFRVVNLRYFNPIGAHISGLIGENPSGIPNNLLPYVMKVVSKELEEIQVFGDDYETPDGTGIRDYINVVDLALGHLKAYGFLEKQTESGFFEVFNLGTGKGTSVLEIINFTKKITGKDLKYKIVGRRTGDLSEVYCNPSKSLQKLDWKANISIEESIRSSINFVEKS